MARWHSVQPWADRALVLALVALGLAEFLHGGRFSHPPHVAVTACAVVLLPLPFLVRRRYPVQTLAWVLTVSLLLTLVLSDPAEQQAANVFLSWLIASFAAGRYATGRPQLTAIAIGMTSAIVFTATSLGAGGNSGDVLPAVAFAIFVWVMGRALRQREVLLELVSEQARQLEQDRDRQVHALVGEERARIARELHDVVAHSVSVMVVQAQAGPRLLANPTQTTTTFRAIETTGREALTELRRLLGILRTEDEQLAIGPQPGLESLPSLVEQVRDAGLPVELVIEGNPSPLPVGVDLSAYRIVQEALTNTLKHAGRASARISVTYEPDALSLDIRDDGGGSGLAAVNGSGHGLVGMRERAMLYGGELQAGPLTGGGYGVRVRLPVDGIRR